MRTVIADLWDYSQNSARWTTFRVGPEGHNILRFDNARRSITGKAEIRALPTEAGVHGAVVDLSSLYRDQGARVTRSIRLRPNRTLYIEDEWATGDRAVEASWQWLTKADGVEKTTRGGVLLRHARKSLELQIELSSGDADITIEEVSEPRNPQDSPNPGLHRIVVRSRTEARSAATLRANVLPESVRDAAEG